MGHVRALWGHSGAQQSWRSRVGRVAGAPSWKTPADSSGCMHPSVVPTEPAGPRRKRGARASSDFAERTPPPACQARALGAPRKVMSRFSSCLYLRERTRKPIAARRPRQIRLQPARPPLFAAGAPPDAPQRLQVRRVGGVRVHGRHGARSVARETPRALRRRAPPDPRTRGIAGVTAYLSPWRVPAFRRCARATTTLACRLRRRRRRQLRERCQKFVSGGASVHQSELARVGHRGGDIERRLRGGVHHIAPGTAATAVLPYGTSTSLKYIYASGGQFQDKGCGWCV